jgi:hypothetical protein
MSLQNTIQSRMIDAIKSKDAESRNAYRFLKGKLDQVIQQPVPDEIVIALVRTLLLDAKNNPGTFSERETEIMQELVPPVLDYAATKQYLVDNGIDQQVKASPKDGHAIGVAMRAFAQGKRCVAGDVVRAVVSDLRS